MNHLSMTSDDPVAPTKDRVVRVNGPFIEQEPGDPFCDHRWHPDEDFATRRFCSQCGMRRSVVVNLLGP